MRDSTPPAVSPRTASPSTRRASYSLSACLVTEIVMTFGFLFVILGSTHGNAPKGFAPIAIGLCLTLIHLISIPVTNTSVNPARSTGPALFAGGWALSQLWLFWVAPLARCCARRRGVPLGGRRRTRADRRDGQTIAPTGERGAAA
jgi:glycerol uptake facilitator-like aquaporin